MKRGWGKNGKRCQGREISWLYQCIRNVPAAKLFLYKNEIKCQHHKTGAGENPGIHLMKTMCNLVILSKHPPLSSLCSASSRSERDFLGNHFMMGMTPADRAWCLYSKWFHLKQTKTTQTAHLRLDLQGYRSGNWQNTTIPRVPNSPTPLRKQVCSAAAGDLADMVPPAWHHCSWPIHPELWKGGTVSFSSHLTLEVSDLTQYWLFRGKTNKHMVELLNIPKGSCWKEI